MSIENKGLNHENNTNSTNENIKITSEIKKVIDQIEEIIPIEQSWEVEYLTQSEEAQSEIKKVIEQIEKIDTEVKVEDNWNEMDYLFNVFWDWEK